MNPHQKNRKKMIQFLCDIIRYENYGTAFESAAKALEHVKHEDYDGHTILWFPDI